MNKICVYTCITGDYDSLKNLSYPDNNFDYICFTNNKDITSDFWKVVYISEDLDNLTLARKIKILGHDELKKYDLTIWLDGAMQLRKPLSTFLDECCDLDNYDMVGFNHRDRDCIYDEIDTCVFLFKESVENAKKIETFLRKEKYPEHNGLIESTALVRKNNDSVKKLMKLWFDMVTRFSRRDQLSFNYCLWKNPIRIQMLDMHVFNNDYFIHEGHCSVEFSKKYRVYFCNQNSVIYKNIIDGVYECDDNRYYLNFRIPFDCDGIELMISPFDCVILNDFWINTTCDIILNSIDIGDKRIFSRYHNIIFKKNFKKSEEIRISLDITPIGINDIFNDTYGFMSQIIQKNEEYKYLLESYNDAKKQLELVSNSKSWKILERLRKIKK